ncbi:TonB-dependent receptor [uncultured Kordia sp.]|uniref:TonB-dependent receptor domain-containing protein n=1 Tax=uncultured Kordia sp. TaxID=507699 RepID=UPI00262BF050|nr:TonB-dependent receptor [uncultured Kordia sp.]
MKKVLLALMFIIISNEFVYCQYTIEGVVTDAKNNPLPDVFISVLKDNEIVKNLITDSIGYYKIENLKRGNYNLNYHHIGYTDSIITIDLQKNTIQSFSFNKSTELSTVVITAEKNIIERKTDRLRFNVANSDLIIGNSTWETLNKTPFVSTNENGSIEIAGTSGVIVYINNRKKRLSGEVLMNYLKSLPADNLEAIEVITTPSSRFEAEGGAGIINIVTKKNKEEGLEGNTSVSTRQTRLFSEAGSIYLNYRKTKWNLYGTAYLSNRERLTNYEKDIFYDESSNIETRFIDRENTSKTLFSGVNLGVDYEINSNHIVGMLLEYSGSDENQHRDAISFDSYALSDSLTFTKNKDEEADQNYSLNLNYQGKLSEKGTLLTVDVDFIEFSSDNTGISKTDVVTLENNDVLYIRDWFRNATVQDINNTSFKLDLELPINDNISIETGVKLSFSKVDNDLDFDNRDTTGMIWIDNSMQSNFFEYDENINAIYAVINHTLSDKWSYQLGTRLENTIAKGKLEGERVVDKNYTNFFPTAFLKYAPNNKHSFVFSVSSRITRPSFWDVNPFRVYTTDRAFFEGNPFLNPSRYYRQELNYTKNKGKVQIIAQIAASQLFDEFYALPFNSDEGIIINRKTNYGNKYSYSGSITLATRILSWWRLNTTTLFGHVQTTGSYADDTITIDSNTLLLSLTANQTFTLSKVRGISLTIFAKNTFPFTLVNTEIGNRLETEIALRKNIGNFSLSLSGRDLFRSNKDRYDISVGDIRINDTNYHDTRSVAFAIRYAFGKSTVKNQRYRDPGNSDIQRRL